jgi:hypothetical protein
MKTAAVWLSLCCLRAVTAQETKPVLRVSPAALVFDCSGGESGSKQSLAISVSTGSLAFTASTATGWISVEPSGGTAAQVPAPVTVGVQCAGAQERSLSGSVTVAAAGTANGAVSVPVRVQTKVVAELRVLNAYIALTGRAGMGGVASQTISLGSSTGEPVAFQATASGYGGNWLSISPTSGSAPSALNVTANLSGLAPGNYSGTVVVTWGGGRSAGVAVTLTVTPN